MKGLFFALLFTSSFACAQTEALWLRYPAISPDGSTIAFSYKGDLYAVPVKGGNATPLTLHEAHEMEPVWSPDGKMIAFASDRFGDFDVFVMPATGGEAKRISYHSNAEHPYSFTPDGKNVVFGATRLDDKDNRQYPTGYMPELYTVSVSGGRVIQILTTPAEDVSFGKDASTLYYHDKTGGENQWRKHQTSAVARDIWVYNAVNDSHKRLTANKGEDRTPLLSPDGTSIYYLSENGSSFNVYRMNTDGSNPQAVTNFKTHPVRFLSMAKNGTLCFAYDGSIYTHQNGQSTKVPVNIIGDARSNNIRNVSVSIGVSGMSLSPSGKEVAFIYRGDVFVTNTDGRQTKQVTKTPGRETDVTWHKDGRMLLYAAERNSKWQIFKTEMTRDADPYFFASTVLKETAVTPAAANATNPKLSPDGKMLAYVENFNTLRLSTLANGQTTTLVTPAEWLSWGDRGHDVLWSPDSKWLVTDYARQGIGNGEIGILSADGKTKLTNLSKSGFGDGNAKWMMKGDMLLWFSDRDGLASKANSGGSQNDAYGLFLNQAAWDQFNLNKDEAALAKEIKAKADTGKNKTAKKDSIKAVAIEWDDLEKRKTKLTIHSSSMSDALVDETGENIYYLARFEKGYNLWTTNLKTKETKVLAPLNANSAGNMHWDKDGKKIYLQSDGGISKIDVASGKPERISISGDMELNAQAEREVMFDHVWRRTRDIFYKKDFHGIDWNTMGTAYRKFLPHISNPRDFEELLSEMLGELNVSHCGARYFNRNSDGDATAALGIFYDQQFNGAGVKIEEVIKGGPLDKAGFSVQPGTIIEAIDGDTLTAASNLEEFMNRKAGKTVLLSLLENGNRRELVVKPISIGEENRLLYDRWVNRNADEVSKLSNGKLGYIHIPSMGDGPYRQAIEDAMGKFADRSALVVDTRNNGGGDLVADLAMWLSGKRFMEYSNDKEVANYEPTFRWNKPSISLANEGNYSDGHCYAFAYKYLSIGKLVGMPVPGTCSFAGWELLQDGTTRWGTVPMGVRMMDGSGRYLENSQTEPDIKLMNEYTQVSSGVDQQLATAVAELMKSVK